MRDFDLDLDALLNPAAVFDHPQDVLNDPHLTRREKRAILSSWASDVAAIRCLPGLCYPPEARHPVTFDDIVDALRSLDDDADCPRPAGVASRVRSRWRNRPEGPGGTPLSA
jgi:hypothetical protein